MFRAAPLCALQTLDVSVEPVHVRAKLATKHKPLVEVLDFQSVIRDNPVFDTKCSVYACDTWCSTLMCNSCFSKQMFPVLNK